jgi:hypothetical protein
MKNTYFSIDRSIYFRVPPQYELWQLTRKKISRLLKLLILRSYATLNDGMDSLLAPLDLAIMIF